MGCCCVCFSGEFSGRRMRTVDVICSPSVCCASAHTKSQNLPYAVESNLKKSKQPNDTRSNCELLMHTSSIPSWDLFWAVCSDCAGFAGGVAVAA